eukprot:scaffold70088_cov33-Phaeocystis_antarctica.AAC.1
MATAWGCMWPKPGGACGQSLGVHVAKAWGCMWLQSHREREDARLARRDGREERAAEPAGEAALLPRHHAPG